MSHWAFVLMGLHLGMHIPVMFSGLMLTDKLKTVISVALCVVAGIGLFLFIRNGMPDYLFFRVPFAFASSVRRSMPGLCFRKMSCYNMMNQNDDINMLWIFI